MHLVSKRDENVLVENHLVDSVLGILEKDLSKYFSIADLGSGNGFPGIVLGVLFSDKKVYLLEINKKKSSFLMEAKSVLDLKNVCVLNQRVESFDFSNINLVTSRAFEQSESIKKMLEQKKYRGDMLVWEKREFGERVSFHSLNVENL